MLLTRVILFDLAFVYLFTVSPGINLISIAVINKTQKASWEGKTFFHCIAT